MSEQRNNPLMGIHFIEVQFTCMLVDALCVDLLDNNLGSTLKDTMVNIPRVPMLEEVVISKPACGMDQLLKGKFTGNNNRILMSRIGTWGHCYWW
ncbi:Os07g0134650 [Oryza sativa Japonica Group]|uniref:Os07g0134650 protein n=1 Tax=Oryza sativa subsp. japonica TaxID=39947 RepID=A0A0N7KMW6_ORYSJ|nr:hypothetical protein EE612_036994 [Oryza sativa]BAS99961.1 Os07g0134650 [Oryza sativa Japonica Group]